MKKTFFLHSLVVVGACSLLVPGVIRAAQVSFEVASREDIGNNAAVIEVYIDPQAKELNVVEGVVGIVSEGDEDLSVIVENGESVLKLWPIPPQYDAESRSIRFSGGSPQGFSDTSLIFRLRLQAAEPERVTAAWLGGMAYLNDGKGTAEPISAKSLKMNMDIESDESGDVEKMQEGNSASGIIIVLVVLLSLFAYGYKKIFSK